MAGTSCVDYSNLNNEKKGLDDGGESGQTFTGMMNWVDRTQVGTSRKRKYSVLSFGL